MTWVLWSAFGGVRSAGMRFTADRPLGVAPATIGDYRELARRRLPRQLFDYIDGDDTQWEKEPLEHLAKDGQLMAYRHHGFWQCMDTIRDKKLLEQLWDEGNPPWKSWS